MDDGFAPLGRSKVFLSLIVEPLLAGKPEADVAAQEAAGKAVDKEFPAFWDYLERELGDGEFFVGERLTKPVMHSPLLTREDHGDFGTVHRIFIKITLHLRKNIAPAVHSRVRICVTKIFGSEHPSAEYPTGRKLLATEQLRAAVKQRVFVCSSPLPPIPLPFINRLGSASLARETAERLPDMRRPVRADVILVERVIECE